jgi:hypothetical protein
MFMQFVYYHISSSSTSSVRAAPTVCGSTKSPDVSAVCICKASWCRNDADVACDMKSDARSSSFCDDEDDCPFFFFFFFSF